MLSPFFTVERDILSNKNLTNTDRLLYIYIASMSNNDKSACFAENEYLCEQLNIKTRQLYYSLAKLKQFNYIKIVRIRKKRYLIPTINEFIEQRENENNNKKIELVDYDWLNESEENENE